MIILRKKLYSAPTTKVMFKMKQAGNSLKLGATRKTREQLMRETITQKNNLQTAKQKAVMKKEELKMKALDKAVDYAKKAESSMYNPGHAVNKAVGEVVSRPVQVAVSLSPIPTSTATIAPFAEKGARKFKAYARVTDKLKNRWSNSSFAKKLDRVTMNDVSNFVNTVPIPR